jgi:hypothetical protein
MVRIVIGAWGGTVVLKPRPGGGTLVTLTVPHGEDGSAKD